MTIETIKDMLDACYQAKRIRELLPALPKGVTSSYIHFLDTIEKREKRGLRVKISDIGEELKLPLPGVTRTVKEMEAGGYLQKTVSREDGRVTYLSIPPKGRELSQKYNGQYFEELAPLLSEISEEEVRQMIHTVDEIYRIMSERRITL